MADSVIWRSKQSVEYKKKNRWNNCEVIADSLRGSVADRNAGQPDSEQDVAPSRLIAFECKQAGSPQATGREAPSAGNPPGAEAFRKDFSHLQLCQSNTRARQVEQIKPNCSQPQMFRSIGGESQSILAKLEKLLYLLSKIVRYNEQRILISSRGVHSQEVLKKVPPLPPLMPSTLLICLFFLPSVVYFTSSDRLDDVEGEYASRLRPSQFNQINGVSGCANITARPTIKDLLASQKQAPSNATNLSQRSVGHANESKHSSTSNARAQRVGYSFASQSTRSFPSNNADGAMGAMGARGGAEGEPALVVGRDSMSKSHNEVSGAKLNAPDELIVYAQELPARLDHSNDPADHDDNQSTNQSNIAAFLADNGAHPVTRPRSSSWLNILHEMEETREQHPDKRDAAMSEGEPLEQDKGDIVDSRLDYEPRPRPRPPGAPSSTRPLDRIERATGRGRKAWGHENNDGKVAQKTISGESVLGLTKGHVASVTDKCCGGPAIQAALNALRGADHDGTSDSFEPGDSSSSHSWQRSNDVLNHSSAIRGPTMSSERPMEAHGQRPRGAQSSVPHDMPRDVTSRPIGNQHGDNNHEWEISLTSQSAPTGRASSSGLHPRDAARSRVTGNGAERIKRDLQPADGLSEYDHLFLLHDYRLRPRHYTEEESSIRQKRLPSDHQVASASSIRAESLTLDKMSQVRTIYFGGFFPWLADNMVRQAAGIDDHTDLGRTRSQADHSVEAKMDAANKLADKSNDPRKGQSIKHRLLTKKRNRMGIAEVGQGRGRQLLADQKADEERGRDSKRYVVPLDTLGLQNTAQQLSTSQPLASNIVKVQNITTEINHQLGKFILPAVRLALDHINSNQSILSAYKLEVVPRDTQCNATISLKQFFDMVYEEPKKMLLYGDACRASTDPIAKASYFFDLVQISYADTDPIYTIENYPNFFRVVPSENALSLARIPFIRHFNWTRVGTIYQNLPRYSLPHSKLLTDLERFKIVIKQSVSLPGSVDNLQNRDLGDELRKLKDKDVRIILGNFDEEWALLLFCEAYREKMIGRKYQWILTGFSEANLWQFYERQGKSSCTKQELLVAMDGYIVTDITPVTRTQHRTISGMMPHEYLNEYRKRAREMNTSLAENKFYGYVYDGIWAIALALNRVDGLLKRYSRLAREGKVKLKPELESIDSLLDFEYHQPIWVKLLRAALNETRFDGVTGTVSFHKNERPGLITFSQFQPYRDMNEVIIGSYDALNDKLDLKVGFPIIWRGSSPPIDYTIQRLTPFRINRTLFVIISVLAMLGIVLACVFLFVNIKFRNQRYIKMSSPYLNNLIIIGCILTFTSVIILGLDSGLTSEFNFPYICNARAWVLMAGFTLAFGSMFSKTFRVHSIFTNIKLHKKVIKDYKLFMVVFILLTFDVCILVVWQYFDPFYRETNNGTSIQDPDNEDVIIVPEMEHCQSKRMTIFLSVIYVYKGLLMAFGCFLAWETRHVSIPALNDSKYIGLSVYNVVIMCVIGASLSFILRDQQDASFVIISVFIIFCSTTTLCLVFVPKVRMLIELKQNPRADHRVRATLKNFKKSYHEEAFGAAAGCRDIHGNLIGRGYGMDLNERIKILADENVKQRSLLKEKTYELEALTSKYRKIQSMVQSGQYLQAISTSALASGSAATQLGPSPCGSSFRLKTIGASGSMILGATSSTSAAAAAAATAVAPFSGGTIEALRPQSTGSGGPTTSVLLTSRSPTRERVSFRQGSQSLEPTVAAAIAHSSSGNTSALTDAQPISTASGRQGGGPCHGVGAQPVLFGSASLTQLTNTNTTSSGGTNNLTELTADYCSSARMHSSGTNSTAPAVAAMAEATELDERIHEISRQVAAQAAANCGDRSKAVYSDVHRHFEKDTLGDECKISLLPEGACGATTPSRSLARFKGSKAMAKSQEDLSLFTVLSCLEKPRDSGQLVARASECELNVARSGDRNEVIDRWFEGPFCSLVLRQSSLEDWRRDRTVRRHRRRQQQQHAPDQGSALQQPFERSGLAGCGYIGERASIRSDLNCRIKAPSKRLLLNTVNRRLPRTLSMIEYLGLNELDLIARRHDRILRHRRYIDHRWSSCCRSCNCCRVTRQIVGIPKKSHDTDRSRIVEDDHDTQGAACQYAIAELEDRTNERHSCVRNFTTTFSSSEPINSDYDFQQTHSIISCSTCCSLAFRSYGTNSVEIYDEQGSMMTSDGSISSSDNNNDNLGHDIDEEGVPNNLDDSSVSRSVSSSVSKSSSIIVGGARHHYKDTQPRLSGSPFESVGSLSLSQLSPVVNKQDVPRQNRFFSDQHQHYHHHHHHHHHHQRTHHLEAHYEREQHSQHQLICDRTHQHQHTHQTHQCQTRDAHYMSQTTIDSHRIPKVVNDKELPICMSGVLYGNAGSQEAANGAAHVVGPIASTSGEPAFVSSSNAVEDLINTNINEASAKESAQPLERPIIRCDILENL